MPHAKAKPYSLRSKGGTLKPELLELSSLLARAFKADLQANLQVGLWGLDLAELVACRHNPARLKLIIM